MDKAAIGAAWDEWNEASTATDMAYRRYKSAMHYGKPRGLVADHKAAWEATLDRTDAARKAVAGLPDLDELAAWEKEQAEISAAEAAQGRLL